MLMAQPIQERAGITMTVPAGIIKELCSHKSIKQIKNMVNAYVVRDTIEIGSNNIIPIWLFGFLY